MAFKPNAWYKFQRYSQNHSVHADDPSIGWCGRPMVEDEGQPATNTKKNCPFCREKMEHYRDEKAALKVMKLQSEGAKW